MRHGETDWNVAGRLQGMTDIPLNESGRRMAISCGKGMHDIHIDECISSPLKRARETAELVLRQNDGYQDGKGIPFSTDERLREAGFGPWEGLICKADGYSVPLEDFGTYWREPESPLIVDGVERITEVEKRVEDFLDELEKREGQSDRTVLLVVHGCVIRTVFYLMNGRENFCNRRIPYNCEVVFACPGRDANGRIVLGEMGREIFYDLNMLKDYYVGMKDG